MVIHLKNILTCNTGTVVADNDDGTNPVPADVTTPATGPSLARRAKDVIAKATQPVRTAMFGKPATDTDAAVDPLHTKASKAVNKAYRKLNPLKGSDVAGAGTLFTWSVVHQPFHPVLRDVVPYIVGIVEIDGTDGTRITTNIVDTPHEQLRAGLRVEVVWEDMSPELAVPRFRAAG